MERESLFVSPVEMLTSKNKTRMDTVFPFHWKPSCLAMNDSSVTKNLISRIRRSVSFRMHGPNISNFDRTKTTIRDYEKNSYDFRNQKVKEKIDKGDKDRHKDYSVTIRIPSTRRS